VNPARARKPKPQAAAPSPVELAPVERANDSLPGVPEVTAAPIATVSEALDDTLTAVGEAVAPLVPALR
jgi:hypothetical protein